MKYALLSAALLATAIAGLTAHDIHNDRSHSVEVLAPTVLVAEARPQNYGETHNRVLTTLAPGSQITVLRIRYEKDFMAIRIRTDSDLKGWVIFGPTIEVTRE
jgi:hypothetical protein